MTQNSSEPRRVRGAGVREDQAAADTNRSVVKVAHASDNAQQCPRATDPTGSVETDETAAIRDYWAAAKKLYQRGEYDDYGSDSWKALDIEDPRKMAGLVAFAELWRRYNPEIADDFNRQLRAPQPLWQRPTLAELNQAHADMLARNRRSSRKEAA